MTMTDEQRYAILMGQQKHPQQCQEPNCPYWVARSSTIDKCNQHDDLRKVAEAIRAAGRRAITNN